MLLRSKTSLLVLPLLIVLALLLGGCSALAGGAKQGEKPLVLTTFTVLADMGRNVAGDHLDVVSITKVGAEIHGYEPTPKDLAKARGADLILDNGLNLEVWFARFLKDSDAKHVVLTAGIDPIEISGDVSAGKPNPHAWMSPQNALVYVDNIAAAFSELDPENAQSYQRNAESYKAKIAEVNEELKATIATLPPEHRALVTCEGAFSYLTRDVGLTEKYLWPVNAEQQATPGQIASAIEFVEENQVPAVFCESTVSAKAMKQVASASGAKYGGVLYVDSLSVASGPVPTYLDLITYDAKTIIAGLKDE